MADLATGADARSAGLIDILRRDGISDERVLDAMAAVPRERFISGRLAGFAFRNEALPIDCGQTISQPFVVAYMTEKLGVGSHHDVLEIGTGSGYQTAVLARLARHVYTIERHGALLQQARSRLANLGIGNVTAIQADGVRGWPEPRLFDRIIVTARAKTVPGKLSRQIADGGRMILPLGRWPWQERLVLLTRTAHGLEQNDLLPVRFVPLVSG